MVDFFEFVLASGPQPPGSRPEASTNSKKSAKAQWKFNSQKGMKNKLLAKAEFEQVTAEFPQKDDLTIETQRQMVLMGVI